MAARRYLSGDDKLLELDETFRLAAYSTVDTITTDLTAIRARNETGPVFKSLPEKIALAAVGRLELLHPRLGGRPAW